jgi:hypothetical protein
LSSDSQDYGEDFRGAGLLERFGAFVERCAGSLDIVDKADAASGETVSLSHSKSAGNIRGTSGWAWHRGLLFGPASPDQICADLC